MSVDQLKDLVRYRPNQAHETLREAEILFAESAWRGTINRAYYAMFYAASALLATRELGTAKHSGTISLFDREFVKEGVFPREMSRSLHTAFDLRQSEDYGEVSEVDAHTVQGALGDAKQFVADVESYLHDIGY